MKQFFHNNKPTIGFIFSLLVIWRLFLLIPSFIGFYFLPQKAGYIGSMPWANFDGVHYLSIAKNGYFQYQQAFFPLYPLLIKNMAVFTLGNYLWAGVIVTYAALFCWLLLLYKLVRIDYSDSISKWVLVFMLFFPTGFFFGAIYTESFFLFLVVGAFYAARRKKWIFAGICVGLASATKLVGIFLLPALLVEWYIVYRKKGSSFNLIDASGMVLLSLTGLVSYCIYLWKVHGDPLFFIHAQPAFGANRSGGELIFLPQVLYRYIKIFLTVPFSNYDVWIALLEFTMLGIALFLLFFGLLKQKMRFSYFLFSFLAILGPTLTGSLSSIPRYVVIAFPLFIVLALLKSTTLKAAFLFISAVFLVILCSYFLQGYFIS